MTIHEARAHVKSRIWKSIAKSDLDLSALPEETLEKLIDLVADSSLVELDYELGRVEQDSDLPAAQPTPEELEDENEKILWEGRPFLSLTTHYRITTERIRITEGLLGKARIDIELVKIQDITQNQRFSERVINVGDIQVTSHDPNHPMITLENVTDVQYVHEVLRRAMLEARNKVNFSYREQM